MDIGLLLVALWVLLSGIAELGWFTVDVRFMGIIAVVGALIWIIEGVRRLTDLS